jgi:outer membrane receptor for ferric coprogen and ferric-rhodotorulic acid
MYRSELLLDQDRAVRSANLAGIYRDAGMFDVSVREAGRAVNDDYANYSAHLFLANSYNELRDPNRINLRYETAADSEYLIANLLAPVGAGTLSPQISQEEYSKMFERDRFGFLSSSEYLSRGAWNVSAAQYGSFGNFAYDLEAAYLSDNGQRPNNDFEDKRLALQIKQQVTLADTVFVGAILREAERGDLAQYYDQSQANTAVRSTEEQSPILLAGYHHEWQPGVHTIALVTRLHDQFTLNNPSQVTLFVSKNGGVPDFVSPFQINEEYQNTLEIYSVEAQQIWQHDNFRTIAGVRYQNGEFDTQNLQTDPADFFLFFDPNQPAAAQHFKTDFERLSAYTYLQWNILDPLALIGGVSYDWLTFPENFRAAPISDQQEDQDQLSPKAGLIWTPDGRTAIRAAYSRSLAGASFDQSFQLEPSQVAGFNQSFRSLIPESVGGANAGAEFEMYGLSLERRVGTGTYLGVSGEMLNSEVRRTLGVFDLLDPLGFAVPSGTREHLDFEEQTLLVTLDQRIGQGWNLGLRYRLTKSTLEDDFVEIPDSAVFAGGFTPRQELRSTLNQLNLYTIYNHPTGAFAQVDGAWYSQSNHGYSPAQPGDDFWQLNLLVGYRFPRRQAEVTVGILNLTDTDYRLNPLTLYNDLPRERTFVARLRFSF